MVRSGGHIRRGLQAFGAFNIFLCLPFCMKIIIQLQENIHLKWCYCLTHLYAIWQYRVLKDRCHQHYSSIKSEFTKRLEYFAECARKNIQYNLKRFFNDDVSFDSGSIQAVWLSCSIKVGKPEILTTLLVPIFSFSVCQKLLLCWIRNQTESLP